MRYQVQENGKSTVVVDQCIVGDDLENDEPNQAVVTIAPAVSSELVRDLIANKAKAILAAYMRHPEYFMLGHKNKSTNVDDRGITRVMSAGEKEAYRFGVEAAS